MASEGTVQKIFPHGNFWDVVEEIEKETQDKSINQVVDRGTLRNSLFDLLNAKKKQPIVMQADAAVV